MTDETSSEQEATSDPQQLEDRSIERIMELTTDINDLEQEIHQLKLKLLHYERRPSNTVAYVLVLIGACSLVFSVVWTSQILAFIGLGLTFWGALLLYARPKRYVASELVDSTAISAVRALGQIVGNLGYVGTPIYLPPMTLKDIKDSRMFLPAKNETTIPTGETVAKGTIMVEDPEGILLVPPGLGLANLFEEKLGVRFVEVDLDYLKTNLPRILIEQLELVEGVEVQEEGDAVQVKMEGSAYASLCTQIKKETETSTRFGCPLCSAIAVMLSRTTHRPVIIEQEELSKDKKTTVTQYRILPE